MCGIVFTKETSEQLAHEMLKNQEHRGPDDSRLIALNDDIFLGFARLAINDESKAGMQPFKHSNLAGCVNGEIYNARALIQRFDVTVSSQSDIEVVLPLFKQFGPSFISLLKGFYAGVLVQTEENKVWTIRDPFRKKPLWLAYGEWGKAIVSEQKSITLKSNWIEIPAGCAEINFETLEIRVLYKQPLYKNRNTIMETAKKSSILEGLQRSIQRRIPSNNQPLAVFLSGGIDSSLLLALTHKQYSHITSYVLGDMDSQDVQNALMVTESLQLPPPKIIPLPSVEELSSWIERAVYALESSNPSIISNGLATMLVAKEMHKDGIKIAFGGEGADEVFNGYKWFEPTEQWSEFKHKLIDDLWKTELRRLDLASMAYSIEVRCPFLDVDLFQSVCELQYEDFFGTIAVEEQVLPLKKLILRQVAQDILPREIVIRPKMSFDVGSGIRGLVVSFLRKDGKTEREVLKSIFEKVHVSQESSKYNREYPAFDKVIDQRGSGH